MTENYDGFEVEDNDREKFRFPDSRTVKVWNLPLYLLRKVVYVGVLTNCFLVDKTAKLLGFKFEYEFSEKRHWAWLRDFTWPRPFMKMGLKKND
ncbi:hypothetical protein OSG_eHP35_00055 [environmental Halophage eHP-35]|nr:hypothetical protein OSG_eHP35_00055 [environmental Halophage eHP-35]